MLNRKDDHIRLAQEQFHPSHFFDDEIEFVHQSLPLVHVDKISSQQSVLGKKFAWPFFINAMTGGSSKTKRVNASLAQIAKDCNLAMAVGSMSPIFKDPSNKDSYTIVREVNPDGIIFSNLNLNYSPSQMQEAVDLIEADALQLHINAPQELVMPEGDRDFSQWLKKIEASVKQVKCPVIIKEVGFGMSQETIQQLLSVGVKAVDISGRGGTSFTRIEGARRKQPLLSNWDNWGIPTPIALLEARAAFQASKKEGKITLIASGGVQTPMDVAKCLALGADLVGLSGFFLQLVLDHTSKEACRLTKAFQEEFLMIMALLACQEIKDFSHSSLIFGDRILNWAKQRHLSLEEFSTTKGR
ncbi:type 2 isopentenyl-diphosphate Delta-isomerase [Atopobacter sp. AH10]|uniref:type 2 isopentenyl-diphosphate Delta-isomerase n=1 Tax=Atopobacter sp. AH10 TaxID=2315861 RepID=UPI000EF17AA2|nr:type 2 isopentenyl-diphosphate Delta-isomerase [Atopobacter sp. AH10]RLK63897.1 type 2 isopentenyl-diphosphate Delta-isomerase [Atopobacter sp. AH10]